MDSEGEGLTRTRSRSPHAPTVWDEHRGAELKATADTRFPLPEGMSALTYVLPAQPPTL